MEECLKVETVRNAGIIERIKALAICDHPDAGKLLIKQLSALLTEDPNALKEIEGLCSSLDEDSKNTFQDSFYQALKLIIPLKKN